MGKAGMTQNPLHAVGAHPLRLVPSSFFPRVWEVVAMLPGPHWPLAVVTGGKSFPCLSFLICKALQKGVHKSNPITRTEEVEAEGSEVQGHPLLCTES